jgi:hypothetical protein
VVSPRPRSQGGTPADQLPTIFPTVAGQLMTGEPASRPADERTRCSISVPSDNIAQQTAGYRTSNCAGGFVEPQAMPMTRM